MIKSWIHEDCLELVSNLADMNCSASISDGILTLEDGTQIDLLSTAKVVLDLDVVESIWEIAFGADAWEKNYSCEEVISRLQDFANKSCDE